MIIVNYTSVECSYIAERYYANLTNVVYNIPKHNLVIEMWDLYSHLDKEAAMEKMTIKTNIMENYY